jgi:aminobenzoyl-glutamate utilization protein B
MRKIFLASLLIISTVSFAQKKKTVAPTNEPLKIESMKMLDGGYNEYKQVALQIWDNAELGNKEVKSSALLQETLKKEGFTVETGVADIQNSFVATYGSGSPVIAILAEFDALPGLSQQAVPEKKDIASKADGHGCGHHLLGTASVAAGISIKKLIEEKKIKGTIKVFGCPTAEAGTGKVYMLKAGLFNDVDVTIHWHPSSGNGVTMTSALASNSAKFRFYGLSAHAAGAPERGRSSLDAVESMNYMVNLMREHIPQETGIHYVITNGGKAPNVVPDFAEVYYYMRHPKHDQLKQIFERVVTTAKAAALGTETKMDYEIIRGTHDILLNKTLAESMQKNLEKVGGVKYNAEEIEFAKKIQSSFTYKAPAISNSDSITPLKTVTETGGEPTDVGDVSYAVPTVGLYAATWVPGTSAHSWQAVACGGTEIGTKGMMVAAKAMALTAIDLFTDPSLIQKSKDEFLKLKGNYKYEALLGNRK